MYTWKYVCRHFQICTTCCSLCEWNDQLFGFTPLSQSSCIETSTVDATGVLSSHLDTKLRVIARSVTVSRVEKRPQSSLRARLSQVTQTTYRQHEETHPCTIWQRHKLGWLNPWMEKKVPSSPTATVPPSLLMLWSMAWWNICITTSTWMKAPLSPQACLSARAKGDQHLEGKIEKIGQISYKLLLPLQLPVACIMKAFFSVRLLKHSWKRTTVRNTSFNAHHPAWQGAPTAFQH